MPKAKINITTIKNAECKSSDYFIWDEVLTGFGVRVTPAGKKTYVIKYRMGHGRNAPTRRVSIGSHGPALTPELARKKARILLSQVVQGGDPALERSKERKALSVSGLCDLYLKEGVLTKKPASIETNKTHIKRHIGPLIGNRRIQDIRRSDICNLMADIAGGKTAIDERTGHRGRAIVRGGKMTANRVVALLSTIYNFAIERDLASDNPVKGVRRFPEKKRERFLSQREFEQLGKALDAAVQNGVNRHAIAIIKVLALTGARRGEIVNLRWDEVDAERCLLRLKDSKTGAKVVYLSRHALEIILSIPRTNECLFVFPGADLNAPYTGLAKVWGHIRNAAGLEDVRIHDLRHSHASVAAAQGAPLAVIARVLGHKRTSTTERYAHLCDDPVRASTASVAEAIFKQLSTHCERPST